MSTLFLLQRFNLESTGQADLPQILAGSGIDCQVVDGLDDLPSVDSDRPIVLYGTIQFVRRAIERRPFSPGAYYHATRFACTSYIHHFPTQWMANGDGFYLTYGELKRRIQSLYELLKTDVLFLRPDSGNKVFTGLAVHRDDAVRELSALDQLTSVVDGSLVLIAPAKKLGAEYRFFVVHGKVITGSLYRRDGVDVQEEGVDDACRSLADMVAAHPWQIDLAYSCDVGIVNGEPKVIELNAFSTSGCYRCDKVALFQEVAVIAALEYDGEVSMSE